MADEPKEVASMTAEELEAHINSGGVIEQTTTPLPSPEEAPEDPIVGLMKEKGLNPESPEDKAKFVDMYANMQRKASSDGTRFKKMQEDLGKFYNLDGDGNVIGYKIQPPPTSPQPSYGTPPEVDVDPLEKIRSSYDTDPLKTTIEIARASARAEATQQTKPFLEDKVERDIERQKKAFAKTRKDFDEVEDTVDEVLNKIPLYQRLTPQGQVKPSLVSDIYYWVKGKKSDELIHQTEQATKLRTEQAEADKRKAFVESGGKPASSPPVDVNKMSASELEAHINSITGKK